MQSHLPLFLAAALLGAGLAQGAPVGAEIHGTPTITDGDSLRLGGTRVRLHGIDAPEADQTCATPDGLVPCGVFAQAALQELVGGAPVSCQVVDIDRYNRSVATCFAGPTHLNAAMAQAGWAIALPHFTPAYVALAQDAQRAGRGIWATEFHSPSEWRRGARW